MKIKPIYLSFLLFISMVSITLGQEKKEEEKPFKCPASCSCIELATDGIRPTQALNSLPFDENFVLFWKKNGDDFLTGTFRLCSDNNELLFSGKMDIQGDYLFAKVSKFLKPNRDFRIEFSLEVAPTSEAQKFIKTLVVKFFIGLGHTPTQNDIDLLREKIVLSIPAASTKFIRKNSILDITSSYNPDRSDGRLFQLIGPVDDILNNFNPVFINDIKSESSLIFNNSQSLKKIGELQGEATHKVIQKMNADIGFAEKVFSGRVNILSGEELPAIDILNLDKDLLDKYMKNINDLIQAAEFWKREIGLSQKAIDDLKGILANYSSLRSQVDTIQSQLNGVVSGSLMEKIIKSFVLTIDSDIKDLETSAKTYVGADVGALMANLTNKPDGYRILPYVGLNLYFVPVNKRASLNRLIDAYGVNALWRILSIHAGVTMAVMSSADYQGIFNVENPKGFIVGFGLRPYRAVKFSAGWLLQNQANGNALNNSFHIASRPYISISLDWEVRNIIPDIKSLFSK